MTSKLLSPKGILDTADSVANFPLSLIGLAFTPKFGISSGLSGTAFTLPLACWAEPLIRSLSTIAFVSFAPHARPEAKRPRVLRLDVSYIGLPEFFPSPVSPGFVG